MEETNKSEWIKVEDDGTFVCAECENKGKPLTNSVEGMMEADTAEIKSQLEAQPTKMIYGVCEICGMEYIFKLDNGELFMEPSNEEK